MIKDRKPRDDPTKKSWTVSVASFPGESVTPELDNLDRSLKKTRDGMPDQHLEEWKRRIVWPEPSVYGTPIFYQ